MNLIPWGMDSDIPALKLAWLLEEAHGEEGEQKQGRRAKEVRETDPLFGLGLECSVLCKQGLPPTSWRQGLDDPMLSNHCPVIGHDTPSLTQPPSTVPQPKQSSIIPLLHGGS